MRHFKSHSFFTLVRRDSVNIATEFTLLISGFGPVSAAHGKSPSVCFS
jgi:hypothetical protein